jgi:hypothetical protein
MPALGQSETPNHVRGDGSFPPKRSPCAGDSCAANHFQPHLLLAAELDQIADAGGGDYDICTGPKAASRAANEDMCGALLHLPRPLTIGVDFYQLP